ncbi:methyl-accepting chemotaxis protein [Effusibacillus lacus]|uniref:Chemotaxis protein n=1 Tax=Effusibacillus lacus TaxID=1348429 RepID=A0A292YPF9_9BACL|nr:methyl-accepting chemotaxis protein [Effusibacillus lacus]TCS72249.1 methyl-accepting chemotaxis sensory transducer with TarH sensor [Effusibacillus lacus]GAX90274.1 chemotaxis protein [Effusibacillus lacus]
MRFRFTIKNKLSLSFASILLVPSIAIGALSYETAKNKVRDQMLKSADENIRILNQTVDQIVESKRQDISLLAQQVAVDGKPESMEIIRRFQGLHPELELSYLGTETGAMFTFPNSKMPDGYDPRKKEWYQEAIKQKDKVIITSPEVSTSTGNMVIRIAKATQDGKGVVATNLNLQKLGEMVKGVKIGEEGYVVVYDKNKKYVIHPTAKPGTEANGEWMDKVYGQDSGSFSYLLDGQSKEMVFVTNKLTGWKISGTMYTDEISNEARPIFYRTLLVIAIAVMAGAALMYFIVRSITRPLAALTSASEKISEGYLNERIDVNSRDELGQLGLSFNKMADSLRTVLVEVNQTATQLAASAEELSASADQTSKATEQIASTIQEVAYGTEQQVQSVEQSVRTVNEMSTGIQQIAVNAQNVSATAIEASGISADGVQAIQTAIRQMESIHQTVTSLAQVVTELGDRSQEIGQIVGVITGIAEQTNLLALNAAIEAARAGEHGRGFAVVADEVRKLAEQSAQSAQQIGQLIATIQDETSKAVQSMDSATKEVAAGIGVVNAAGTSFEQIQNSVDTVVDQIQHVSAASQQMSVGAQQVVKAIDSIEEVTETTAAGAQNVSAAAEEQLASMEEITASASALTNMAEELQKLVQKFKL